MYQIAGREMAFFPEPGGVGGHTFTDRHYKPSQDGPLLFLKANHEEEIDQGFIESAGGKLLIHRTKINQKTGYITVSKDTKGNRIAVQIK